MSIASAARLRVLRATQLLDSAPDKIFDHFTSLAGQLIGVPTSLMSLVDERRQYFKSVAALTPPFARKRETPLSHSLCKFVAEDKAALVVDDAREEPKLRDNGAVTEHGVVAYAGMPLLVEGEALGALCVLDTTPRAWSSKELELLSGLAELVSSEIALRLRIARLERKDALSGVVLDTLAEGVVAVDEERRLLFANTAAREMLVTPDVGEALTTAWREGPRSLRSDGRRLTPDDDELGRALRGTPTYGFQFAIETPSGQARRVEASARPVSDATERIVAAVAVYRDRTAGHAQETLYTTLASNIPRGVVLLFDHAHKCFAIDGGLARREGLDQRALVGHTVAELARLAPNTTEHARAVDACNRTMAGEHVAIDLVTPKRTLQIRTSPVRDALGEITAGFLLALDVTDERRMQEEVRKSAQIYHAIARNLPNGAVILVDRELRIVTADGTALERALGVSNSKLVGRTVQETTSERNRELVLDVYRAAFRGVSKKLELESGSGFYDVTSIPIFDDEGVSHVLVSLIDVTTRKAELLEIERARRALEEHARELREASVTDALTGLLNRRGFTLIADKELKAAMRAKRQLLLFFVDLNDMKAINDNLGHAVGDEALVDTAKLLRTVFREADVIARLGGDEFVVLATDALTSAASTIAARLSSAASQRNAGSTRFALSLSVGTAVFDPAAPCSLDDLLSQADARMYADKQAGRQGRREGARRH